jgi:peptide/nickel transport system substrate-binding protein
MRKQGAIAAATLMAMAGLSACGSASTQSGGSGVLRVGMVGSTSTVDIVDSQIAPLVVSPSLESLVRLQPDGSLEPRLAESVENPSPTVYVYHLRKGVKFWDGQELTSEDVVFSLERYRDPNSYTAAKYRTVDTIEATDKYTVTVTLKTPDSNWPTQASMFSSQIIQKKFYEEHEKDFGNPGTLVMGTGPYEIVKLDPTSGAEFKANPDYWDGDVEFDKMEVKFFDTETNAAIALRAKSVDLVPSVANAKAFESTSKAKIVSSPSCSLGFVALNTSASPWDDVHVRRAVAYAVDRTAFVDDVDGHADAITTFIPPASLKTIATPEEVDAMIESLPQYPHDLAKAKAELAQSDHPDGFEAELPTTDFSNNVTGSQILADQLGKIGIKLTVKNQTIAKWVAGVGATVKKRPAVYTAGAGCTATPGYMPSYWLGSQGLVDGGSNLAGYGPPEVDRLIQQASEASTPEAQFEAYTELLAQLATDVPYIPIMALQANLGIASGFEWANYTQPWWNAPWPLDITHSN